MLGLIKKNHYYKRPVQKSILKKKHFKHFVLNKENTKNCIWKKLQLFFNTRKKIYIVKKKVSIAQSKERYSLFKQQAKLFFRSYKIQKKNICFIPRL